MSKHLRTLPPISSPEPSDSRICIPPEMRTIFTSFEYPLTNTLKLIKMNNALKIYKFEIKFHFHLTETEKNQNFLQKVCNFS